MSERKAAPLLGDDRHSTVLYLIKQVELAIRAQIDEVVGVHGITSTQLARNSFVRIQTMAQHLASLEERNLIRRVRDPQMKRQVLVFLSEQGAKILGELADPIAEIEHRALADLSAADAKRLREQLSSIRISLSGAAPH
jgi:DNA-binding MarR family transcriptional regulator